jgi:hypothetical protein
MFDKMQVVETSKVTVSPKVTVDKDGNVQITFTKDQMTQVKTPKKSSGFAIDSTFAVGSATFQVQSRWIGFTRLA